jgi:hypothetical protein
VIERERDEAKAAAVRALEAEAQEEAARRREEEAAVEAQKVQAKADEDAVWHQQQASWKHPMYASCLCAVSQLHIWPTSLPGASSLSVLSSQTAPSLNGWLAGLVTYGSILGTAQEVTTMHAPPQTYMTCIEYICRASVACAYLSVSVAVRDLQSGNELN